MGKKQTAEKNKSREELIEDVEEVTSAEQVSIRFECLKFAQIVRKENIENLWSTRKEVPQKVSVDELIADAEKIWEYLISS